MCDYPNCNAPEEYVLAVSKAKSSRPEQIIGSICREDMRKSIDKIMKQCFGTIYWATVYDLNMKLLYHSFDADLSGYSAGAGWEIFLSESTENK